MLSWNEGWGGQESNRTSHASLRQVMQEAHHCVLGRGSACRAVEAERMPDAGQNLRRLAMDAVLAAVHSPFLQPLADKALAAVCLLHMPPTCCEGQKNSSTAVLSSKMGSRLTHKNPTRPFLALLLQVHFDYSLPKRHYLRRKLM